MVGLLSGMDNEDRSSDKDVNVCDTPTAEESNTQKPSSEETAAENTDNVEEAEQVTELKSILKRRGQYTFRKVKVDFDLIPKKIPYNEDDYTVEIQIIEKEPVKIKSWAAIFAAKKAEAEAEAAAEAEAQEALKKAEEVQKREALKKAAKLKKVEEQSNSSYGTSLSTELIRHCKTSPLLQRKSMNTGATNDENLCPVLDYPDTVGKSYEIVKTNSGSSAEILGAPETNPSEVGENYQLAESIVTDVLDTIIIPEDLAGTSHGDSVEVVQKHEDDISDTESLETETSGHLQEEHINDLEDTSILEEASLSQLTEDNESLSQEVSNSQLPTRSDTAEKLSDEDASQSHSEGRSSIDSQSEDISLKSNHMEESSSPSLKMHGRKVPKKVLVTASSLVEEILSEVPVVIPTELRETENYEESISMLDENNEPISPVQNELESESIISSQAYDQNHTKDANLESEARRKRMEYKKSNNSKIFEHVKKSLENAAPDILETAVGVLEEIEKIVADKVGSPLI